MADDSDSGCDPFTQAYVALIKGAQPYRHLPWVLKARVGRWLGRRHSFLLQREAAIIRRLQDALGLDEAGAHACFVQLCENTGQAMQMVTQLPKLTPGWIRRNVCFDTPAPLDELRARGGLVLTHHSYHHNLLASCFKGWGLSAFPVANPPEAFGTHEFLYRFTVELNARTQANLAGGRFLYVNDARALLRGIREVVARRQVIYMLCDFDEPGPGNRVYPFLDRTLQIPGGVLRAFAGESVPVYFAGLRLGPHGRYHVGWTPLPRSEQAADAGDPTRGLGQAYVLALQTWVRAYPQAWQGWESAGA